MATRLEELEVEVLGLSATDRANLVRKLISSLDDSRTPGSQTLWLAEAQRRAQEIDDGKVTCSPAEEVLARARKQLQ